jgi:competence protein ComEA
MAPAPGPQRALLVLGAALLALGAWTAGPSARRSPELAVPDEPALVLRIDLNRSSVADLETLPGVGAVLAARIAARREAHGPLRSVDDLRQVPGITEKLVETLRPLVTVAPVPEPVR